MQAGASGKAKGGDVVVSAGNSSFGGAGGSISIQSGINSVGQSGDINIASQTSVSRARSGLLSVSSGLAKQGTSGSLQLSSGSSELGQSGSLYLSTGDSKGPQGDIRIAAGASVDSSSSGGSISLSASSSGMVNITTAGRTSTASGDVAMQVGPTSTMGSGGNVNISAGSLSGRSGVGGNILLQGGSAVASSRDNSDGGAIALSGGPSTSRFGGSVQVTSGTGLIQSGAIQVVSAAG
ncbi:hypothetical protein PC128_g26739, partial [Phytophthora cactorum]